MARQLLIKQCPDHLMWYSKLVGQTVPLLRVLSDCYMSQEPAGYSNIVKFEDADIVE